MSVIESASAPTHTMHGASFTSIATPTRGNTGENSLWRVQLEPGTAPAPHSLTREEILVVLGGTADVWLDQVQSTAKAGDAIVVPKSTSFALGNTGAEPLELLCCFPVGGQAQLPDGALMTPPWAK